jgi:hypothetical protein
MALPLLARGLATIASTEAILGGEALGAEFSALAARLGGPQLGLLVARLIQNNEYEITVPVSSSAIRSIGYKVGGIITVEFIHRNRGSYEYAGTKEVFMAFLAAPSKGAFFNAHFR